MELIFHFDFVEDSRSQLVVALITSNDTRSVVEQHGNPPEQNPDWDE